MCATAKMSEELVEMQIIPQLMAEQLIALKIEEKVLKSLRI